MLHSAFRFLFEEAIREWLGKTTKPVTVTFLD